jgi:hypothetical protein
MKAHSILTDSAFGPDALRVVGEAFDLAWSEISQRYGSDLAAIDAARVRLAHAVLAVADDNVTDPQALKTVALQIMGMRP